MTEPKTAKSSVKKPARKPPENSKTEAEAALQSGPPELSPDPPPTGQLDISNTPGIFVQKQEDEQGNVNWIPYPVGGLVLFEISDGLRLAHKYHQLRLGLT